MGLAEIIGAIFAISIGLLAIIYRASQKYAGPERYADRAVFKSVGSKYMGYARFSDSNQYLRIKLRQLEDLGVHNGNILQVVVNDFVCDEFVWPGILIKYKKDYNGLMADPGFAKGATIKIIKGEQIILSGVFGQTP